MVFGLEEKEKSSYKLIQNLNEIFNLDLKITWKSTKSTKSFAWETESEQ